MHCQRAQCVFQRRGVDSAASEHASLALPRKVAGEGGLQARGGGEGALQAFRDGPPKQNASRHSRVVGFSLPHVHQWRHSHPLQQH